MKLTGLASKEEYEELILEVKKFIIHLLENNSYENPTGHWEQFLEEWS
jgi:hypothetical protein